MSPRIPGIEVLTEVLIVGAGPTGLMAAVTLVQYGVPCRIIDRRLDRTKVGHASGLFSCLNSFEYVVNSDSIQRVATSDSGDPQNSRTSRCIEHDGKPHE